MTGFVRAARVSVVAALLAAAISTSGASPLKAAELLVYDWNRPVGQELRGFPRDYPPRANGNWVSPINYAAGTFQYRVQIRRQPTPQQMKLQFCVWQDIGVRPLSEMCGPTANIVGRAGTVVTWSRPVALTKLQRKRAINWARPRSTNGVAIKDERGYPISNYGQPSWNWFGENPARWYPLDMRFTVVVVSKGAVFGGWNRYIN
jgi:hypothetical protein